MQTIRKGYPNAFSPWQPEHDGKLQELVEKRESVVDMAKELGRQPSAILKRIKVLGLDAPKPREPVGERDYLPK